ncbi:MAG: prepilin-type N-terminal cleavage/methylation domain-containing protein [Candidatus Solibacter usitatus]|nr:prepilin-type N-terminal cleavage/methylation domain-containing protein [Candidatus Solibacter usitatus]
MSSERGVTLLELVIVAAIAGVIATISFPGVTSGLDSLRLSQASDSLAAFLNTAINHAERRQAAVAVTLDAAQNTVWMHSTEPGFVRKLTLPEGVRVAVESPEPRRFLILPGGAPPGFGVELTNRRGSRRMVRIDPRLGLASGLPVER